MIRVVIADDQALVRGGFRLILVGEPDIEVVAEAPDGAQALAAVREHAPDVVLMDLRMPEMGGIDATEAIVRERHPARVLILTTFDLDEYVYAAMKAGASGFLLKDVDPADLVHAVRVVARGESLLAPAITRRLVEDFVRRPPPGETPEGLTELTDREREVLTLIGRGLSNDEIGARLFISPATVKTHVSRVLGKLGLRDRVQAVVLAYETGLVTPGEAGR